jgi:tetratricopeptide (TPR) repeat protein
VQALVHASRGEHAEAERLAREAVQLLEPTDGLQVQGDALCDLAAVLEAAGRREEAVIAWRDALERYERKGIVPLARRVRERLAEVQPA